MVVKHWFKRYLLGLLILGASTALLTTSISITLFSYSVYPFLQLQRSLVAALEQWWLKSDVVLLRAEIAALVQERDQLLERSIGVQAAGSYADQIQEVVAFKKAYALQPAVLAQVIVKQFGEHEHCMLLDKGANDGVELDMVALYHNNLVGRVVQVFPRYSKLMLVTDEACKVAVVCPATKAHGIYEGTHCLHQGSLSHVSHLERVQEGDVVLSSGDGLVFPQGFALGTVKDVQLEGVQYAIAVQPLIDICAITYCYLIKKGTADNLKDCKP